MRSTEVGGASPTVRRSRIETGGARVHSRFTEPTLNARWECAFSEDLPGVPVRALHGYSQVHTRSVNGRALRPAAERDALLT